MRSSYFFNKLMWNYKNQDYLTFHSSRAQKPRRLSSNVSIKYEINNIYNIQFNFGNDFNINYFELLFN